MCSPALGDTLLFSAALQDLRAYFGAGVEIVHFCMKPNLAAAEMIPGADRRVVVSLMRVGESIRTIRQERVDAFYDFTAWQRLTAFLTLRSGARHTAGFRTAGQYRGRAFDLTAEHRNDRHEVENFRALVQAIGAKSGAAPRVVSDPMHSEPFEEEADIVVFHPWASGQQCWLREWPEDCWVELARSIGRPKTLFVITGSPSDQARSIPMSERLQAAGARSSAFVSPDGFRALSRVLLRARAVVSVNTGVMHLAAILGAPTVSLNGPTNPLRWGAYGERVANVQPYDGSGGYLNLGFEFPRNTEDVMPKIRVEDVVEAVREISKRSGAEA